MKHSIPNVTYHMRNPQVIDYLIVKLMDGSDAIWEVPCTWLKDHTNFHFWNIGAYYTFSNNHYNNCGCQLLEVL